MKASVLSCYFLEVTAMREIQVFEKVRHDWEKYMREARACMMLTWTVVEKAYC